jgi:CDP-diacylglycerol---glycerol-3-phosphate 3-phosphatidyltransferase
MESDTPAEPAADRPLDAHGILNVPNQLTIARLVLSIVCFAFLAWDNYLTALGLFVAAAVTDWVDGFWARRYGQITQLGRVLDPFADKIVICGTFIFLAAVPRPIGGSWLPASAIAPWMAVVVVAREMLVTGLRSFFEEGGVDFSAKWAGKWKMLFQCLAVGVSLYRLSYFDPKLGDWTTDPPPWLTASLHVFVWTAIALTIYSGWCYVQIALQLVRKK